MRILTLMMTVISAAPLFGQNAQELANALSVPAVIPAEVDTLAIPVPEGADVKILGSDYKTLITTEGRVRHLASDVPVHVCFTVTKDGETATSRDYQVVVSGNEQAREGANAKPKVVPELLSWKGGKGVYQFGERIAVDAGVADFAEELSAVTGKPVDIAAGKAVIRFNLLKNKHLGKEGYILDIAADGVSIQAETEIGLYWGTRSLLQMLRLSPELPIGTAVDMPRFALRGFVLDCGRLPVTMNFIKDLVRTMAWYKMNDLQLHLNDNFIFHEHYVDAGKDPFKESYSAFRLESDIVGENGTPLTATDLFYTKKAFRELIDFAKVRGVNIVPEFDVPGHALSFTRVRPDLIYQGPMNYKEKRRCEMLDAANPETVSFIGRVFDEYLLPQGGKKPVFGGCVVHIGADEFFGGAEDYRKFSDALLAYVQGRGYTPRLWGSLGIKKGDTPVRSKGVQLNLWSTAWANAWDSINQGFDVINTNDAELYVVPFAKYYRADFNQRKLYDSWLPNVISGKPVPAGHPRLLGASYALWNDCIDRLYRGYGAEDIRPSIVGMMELLNQRMWGKADRPMPYADFRALVHRIGDAPGTNIGYRKGVEKVDCDIPALNFGKPSVGPAYKATVKLLLKSDRNAPLFRGDGAVFYAADAEGKLSFKRADSVRISYNAKLPVNKECTLEIIAKPGKTELKLDGESIGSPSLPDFHNNAKDIVSSFILPLHQVGSEGVEVKHLTVEPLATPHTDMPLDMPADMRKHVEGAPATEAPTE